MKMPFENFTKTRNEIRKSEKKKEKMKHHFLISYNIHISLGLGIQDYLSLAEFIFTNMSDN